ncbi:MAG: energy-coupling factor transporter ATPase [Defluviitaleaceae bacterium]|nr:energy-coupling factor transporter ATPase [Defluviitaleaceae bacterium]
MPIEIKNLTHIYNPGSTFEKVALDDISLTIADYSFTGLIGHTGSGKSTLIQHLNGLIKPTSGQVQIDGADIHAKADYKRLRQTVGLVFQYPEHQLFELTVYDDVAFGPKNMGLSKDEIDMRVRGALEAVAIPEELHGKSPFELSGGQKRRAAIAGVLAMQPKILILDEPTAGLDPRGRDEILERIRQMHGQLKLTVILVSHSMEDVSRLADTLIVMNNARIAYTGSPSEIFIHSEKLEGMGLAAPQASMLMHRLRETGIDVPLDVFTVKDAVDTLFKGCLSP